MRLVRDASSGMAVALGVSLFLGACASKSKAPTDTLGDCVPAADAACTVTASGGSIDRPAGDASANHDGDSDGGGTARGDGSSCGTADALLNANAACVQCIDTFCCQIDTTCSLSPGCFGIVACVENQACQPGDGRCVQNCEAPYGAVDIGTYETFASCLQTSCPGCPALQQSTLGDR